MSSLNATSLPLDGTPSTASSPTSLPVVHALVIVVPVAVITPVVVMLMFVAALLHRRTLVRPTHGGQSLASDSANSTESQEKPELWEVRLRCVPQKQPADVICPLSIEPLSSYWAPAQRCGPMSAYRKESMRVRDRREGNGRWRLISLAYNSEQPPVASRARMTFLLMMPSPKPIPSSQEWEHCVIGTTEALHKSELPEPDIPEKAEQRDDPFEEMTPEYHPVSYYFF
ncbi:hypothetical protein BDW22DRAFT_1423249 [Trametopsis cervina]|nr:hypothetical protein BDW22DRAFT_1423249 [Trametopsis cervina]